MYYSSLMWDGGRPIIGRYCVILLSNVERLKGAKRASLKVLENSHCTRWGKTDHRRKRASTAAVVQGLTLMQQSDGQPKQVEDDETRHQHLKGRSEKLVLAS